MIDSKPTEMLLVSLHPRHDHYADVETVQKRMKTFYTIRVGVAIRTTCLLVGCLAIYTRLNQLTLGDPRIKLRLGSFTRIRSYLPISIKPIHVHWMSVRISDGLRIKRRMEHSSGSPFPSTQWALVPPVAARCLHLSISSSKSFGL